jgi:hypothetical protein
MAAVVEEAFGWAVPPLHQIVQIGYSSLLEMA